MYHDEQWKQNTAKRKNLRVISTFSTREEIDEQE